MSGAAPPGEHLAPAAADLCAPVLAAAIRASRDGALADGARPLPPAVRKASRDFFAPDLLDSVRWTVSNARPGVDTLLAGALEYDGAVTLGNVIVFFNEKAAHDRKLWLHELDHVRQYRSLGIDGFARAYLRSWIEIEKRTHQRSGEMLARVERSASVAERT